MAQQVVIIDQCDPCDHLGLPNVPASVKHVIKIDKEPTKEYDFCARCEIAFGPLLEILREHGQETEAAPLMPKQRKSPVRKKPSRELEQASSTTDEAEQPPAEEAAPKTQTEEQITGKRIYIICPLPHNSTRGDKKRLTYANRSGHADQCHAGARIWDIAWEDPDGALSFPCTSHTECIKVGLAFPTETGRTMHTRACPLPRIDT